MLKKYIIILLFLFTKLNVNAQTNFSNQNIITQAETYGAQSVYACDIDGDGDMDMLSASSRDDKIAWYENTDGLGTFGDQQIITTSANGAYSVYACDIDGDGDMDVLSASNIDNIIAWYENTDGNGTFGDQQVITTSTDGAFSVYACDIDGDGDQDVLSASRVDDKIAWYENTDGNGTYGEQQIITISADAATAIYACDIDGDGDQDVLSASSSDDKIAWYENTDGNGTFGEQQVITTSGSNALSVFACDVDGDGDLDVLSGCLTDNNIAWYENTDGNGTFGEQQVISNSIHSVSSVYACDLDSDGDQDVLLVSTSNNMIAWYENIDGMGTFGVLQVITTYADGAKSVYACDIDGDGDQDVLSASPDDNKIAWYENTDGNGTFGEQQAITPSAAGARSVYACDIDNDGDQDVISASYGDNKIAWYENINGYGTFGEQQIITDSASGAISVYACDMDGDGDQDVLSASYEDDKIAWYENIDGKGTFGEQQIITDSTDRTTSVYACDIDGDGDQDVLLASFQEDKIAWYENTDSYGTFGEQQIITESADGAYSVYACDVDGDGDKDVLSASFYDYKIAWYENIDGKGTFEEQQIITTSANGAFSVFACDVDGDGDQDVLSASFSDYKIAWYENTDGKGTFGEQQVIIKCEYFAVSVYSCDIDNDGDQDVLSASANKIAWYENTDGKGTYGEQQVITDSADGAASVYACDIDGDGYQDVLSASSHDDKIAWYKNFPQGSTYISDNHDFNIFVYPNPTTGIITLAFDDEYIQRLWISDIMGKQIIINTHPEQSETLDLSGSESGVYIISFLTDMGIITRKIVKE